MDESYIAEVMNERTHMHYLDVHACDRHPVVYFAQNPSGEIKIGRTTRELIRRRVAALQSASSGTVLLLAYQPLKMEESGKTTEKVLHERFSSDRLSGEWFRPTRDLMQYISSVGPYEHGPTVGDVNRRKTKPEPIVAQRIRRGRKPIPIKSLIEGKTIQVFLSIKDLEKLESTLLPGECRADGVRRLISKA